MKSNSLKEICKHTMDTKEEKEEKVCNLVDVVLHSTCKLELATLEGWIPQTPLGWIQETQAGPCTRVGTLTFSWC